MWLCVSHRPPRNNHTAQSIFPTWVRAADDWRCLRSSQYAEQFFAIWGGGKPTVIIYSDELFFSRSYLFFIASKVYPVKGERRKLVSSSIPGPAPIKRAAVLSTWRSVRWIHRARFMQTTPIAIKEQRGCGGCRAVPGGGVSLKRGSRCGLRSHCSGWFIKHSAWAVCGRRQAGLQCGNVSLQACANLLPPERLRITCVRTPRSRLEFVSRGWRGDLFSVGLKVRLNTLREGCFVFWGCSSPAVFHVYTESFGALFSTLQ